MPTPKRYDYREQDWREESLGEEFPEIVRDDEDAMLWAALDELALDPSLVAQKFKLLDQAADDEFEKDEAVRQAGGTRPPGKVPDDRNASDLPSRQNTKPRYNRFNRRYDPTDRNGPPY